MENTEIQEKSKGETRAFGAEVAKVLKLMIHSLYTNKDIFLRELVSNASDACDRLRYQSLTKSELIGEDSELKIRISCDENARTVTITDNGIGMSREELITNLGTIARSGTQEFMQQMGDGKNAMPLIGQFGVGFYSAFMVADRVEVISRRAGEDTAHRWESDGEGEYQIAPSNKPGRGTTITLHIRKGDDIYLNTFRLAHIIETYSDHIAFPIELVSEDGSKRVVNKGSALWTRPKNDITPEQYREFYRHVAHSPEEPWLTLHAHTEGKIEYTALLYVPGIKPFDLFHPDRLKRVKLYIRRVFITDQGVDLIPAYLRFLRGVVDSEDLPLNISRETLQGSPLLVKIREAVTKRVLTELKKKAEAEPEAYVTFWENFGAVLKEGLCESTTPREQILEACRFHSTTGGEALVGLDTYLDRMQDGQEHIYYLTGDSLEQLRASPQLEGFVKRGIEVLLLTDHVDDFWLSVTPDYKDKPFKSVTRADIDIDKFSDAKTDEQKPEESALPVEMDGLLKRFRNVLGAAVKDVRTTGKLTDSPACLAVEEGAMDIRLERFLLEQKQILTASAKILELNPKHPIVIALGAKLADASQAVDLDEIIWLLFDQARVLEGEPVTDPAAFSRRISAFVQKSLAA